ncbi:MAG TPA: hypothetical protein PLK10_09195 [Ottowia sp.]|nr:hypothetical protein [Ottowia sp.]
MTLAPTQRLGPFPLGMDNRVPDYQLKLPDDSGHLLRDALNVDITARGGVKTRTGYSQAIAGTDCHSLWSPVDGKFALFCDAGSIYRTDAAGVKTLVAAGFGAVTSVRYAKVNEAIYFTDGLRVGSYHPTTGQTPAWGSAAPTVVGDQALTPMPAGQHIAHHSARLLVAVDSVLIYSEPFLPHLRDAARGFELFPAPITCIAAIEAGVFVMADKTYFIQGGFPAQSMRAVLDYGAPDQQAGYRDDGGAHWMSAHGIVSCASTGELANIQDTHIELTAEGAAATLWRQQDGMRAIVAALTEPSDTGAGVGSYAQARIIRKEQS